MIKEMYGSYKMFWHPEKMRSFLEGKITAPIQVRIKPTNKCNHHCYYCAYDINSPEETKINRKEEICYEKMMEILEDLKSMKVKAVTYSGGGEPLIYPYIEEVLEKTIRYGLDLSMITNGQKLEGKSAEYLKQAKWIRVSLDSCDAKTFAETRKIPEKQFYKLINNLEKFASEKPKSCILGINFVVQEKNADKIYDSIKFFRNLGVDNIKLTPRHITKNEEGNRKELKTDAILQIAQAREDFPDFNIYDTYDIDHNAVGVPNRKYIQCYIMQTVPVIAANYNVYPCHDKAWIGIDPLGSIMDKSFNELWFSYETARKFKEFNPKEMCKHHCTNDLKNRGIHNVIKCYGDHINFP